MYLAVERSCPVRAAVIRYYGCAIVMRGRASRILERRGKSGMRADPRAYAFRPDDDRNDRFCGRARVFAAI